MSARAARREWTDEKRKLASKLCDDGLRNVDIAKRVDMSESSVATFLALARPERERPGSKASTRRAASVRMQERDHAVITGGTRTLTAEYFGDPLPGRSALDRKKVEA